MRMTGTLAAAGKAHIGDVALAEIDLRGRAGALDDRRGRRRRARCAKLSSTVGSRLGFRSWYSRAVSVPVEAPCTMTCAPISLSGLSSTGFMCDAWRDARGARLQRLGAADLAAVGGDRGIVRHVLRLERAHLEPAVGESAAEAGDDQRLADIGARSHGPSTRVPSLIARHAMIWA